MTNSKADKTLVDFTDELVAIGGQLTSLVIGMTQFAAEHPNADADPIPVVLRRLFIGAFEGSLPGPAKVRSAAKVLRAASRAIEDEIYLVDPAWLAAQADDPDNEGGDQDIEPCL